MVDIINPHNVPLNDVRIIGMGKIVLGRNCQVRNFTVIEVGNGLLEIGQNSVIGYGSFLQVTGNIKIGQDSLLGPHCVYLASTHSLKPSTPISEIPLIRGNISIGNNVWIGANCTINYNITIHNNSIVGANSFVNKDVKEGIVVAGSPAKYIKDNK